MTESFFSNNASKLSILWCKAERDKVLTWGFLDKLRMIYLASLDYIRRILYIFLLEAIRVLFGYTVIFAPQRTEIPERKKL